MMKLSILLYSFFFLSSAFSQNEADDNLNNTDSLVTELKDQWVKPDTIVTEGRSFLKELYSSSGSMFFYGISRTDTVYWRRDSSLFTGVFIGQSTAVVNKNCETYKKIYNCEDGIPTKAAEYVCNCDTALTSVQMFVGDWGEYGYSFYSNGDTSEVFRKKMIGGQLFTETISYNLQGNAIYYQLNKNLPGLIIKKVYNISVEGDTIDYLCDLHYLDTCNITKGLMDSVGGNNISKYMADNCKDYKVQFYCQFAENGDTLLSVTSKNGVVDGRVTQIAYDEYGSKVNLVTHWENGYLVDVLNENVIYADKMAKFIDERFFIYQMKARKEDPILFFIPIGSRLALGDGTEVILYTPRFAKKLNTPEKVEWSIQKILKKYRKSQY